MSAASVKTATGLAGCGAHPTVRCSFIDATAQKRVTRVEPNVTPKEHPDETEKSLPFCIQHPR